MSTFRPEIDPKYAENMKRIARVIDEAFNGPRRGNARTTGFCLLVFPFGEGQNERINYMSNADRKDMIVAMKELIARFEGHDHEAPQGKQ